jgi:hypothetical protein
LKELDEWHKKWGTDDAGAAPQEIITKLRELLMKHVGLEGGPPSEGLFGDLLGAALTAAGDPEVEVQKWLCSHVPLGIEEPILPSGVFPEVEATGVGPEAFRDAATSLLPPKAKAL